MTNPVPEPCSESAVRDPAVTAEKSFLSDVWSPDGPILLDGRLERRRFAPWKTIVIGLIVAFLLFQGIATAVTLFFLIVINGVSLSEMGPDIESLQAVMRAHADDLIIANSIGQILGLLIPSILFARLHSSNSTGFLRLRGADIRLIALSVVGLFALIPIVQWVGSVTDALPWPQGIRDFEQSQMDMIENILDQDFSVFFAISMMALTPAICEEILFRGYIQRQAERIMGVSVAIIFSGIIFGLYHIRPTQALPLALLGVYMAYLTWRSGSLVPAFIVHLANNSFAVFLGKYLKNRGDTGFDLESIQIPLFIVLSAIAVLVAVTYIFHQTAARLLTETGDGETVPREEISAMSEGGNQRHE